MEDILDCEVILNPSYTLNNFFKVYSILLCFIGVAFGCDSFDDFENYDTHGIVLGIIVFLLGIIFIKFFCREQVVYIKMD